jgi:hypothetical protein
VDVGDGKVLVLTAEHAFAGAIIPSADTCGPISWHFVDLVEYSRRCDNLNLLDGLIGLVVKWISLKM